MTDKIFKIKVQPSIEKRSHRKRIKIVGSLPDSRIYLRVEGHV